MSEKGWYYVQLRTGEENIKLTLESTLNSNYIDSVNAISLNQQIFSQLKGGNEPRRTASNVNASGMQAQPVDRKLDVWTVPASTPCHILHKWDQMRKLW